MSEVSNLPLRVRMLPVRGRVAYVLGLADIAVKLTNEHASFRRNAGNALELGWRWTMGALVPAEDLAWYVEGADERNLSLDMLDIAPVTVKESEMLIVNALAYAARCAFEAEGATSFSEIMDEVSDRALDDVVSAFAAAGLNAGDELDALIGRMESLCAGYRSFDLGPHISRQDVSFNFN